MRRCDLDINNYMYATNIYIWSEDNSVQLKNDSEEGSKLKSVNSV